MRSIVPIVVFAASRNGGTSLVNTINSFEEVAAVEHVLHHGSHEPKLYGYYKFFGNLSSIDKYLDFLYYYSSEDYFTLAEGELNYHLQNRQKDFFHFFFDLMDRYCEKKDKNFWVIKLDPSFFTDTKTFHYFLSSLSKRYSTIKYIKIERDLLTSLNSFLHMEGKGYGKRKKWPYKYFSICAYVQSWFKVYSRKVKLVNNQNILDIDFNEYIKNKKTIINKIAIFLSTKSSEHVSNERFKVNTSFPTTSKRGLAKLDRIVAITFYKLLKLFPDLVYVFRFFNKKKKVTKAPIYRKLLKYNFFRKEFEEDLQKTGAEGILMNLKNE